MTSGQKTRTEDNDLIFKESHKVEEQKRITDYLKEYEQKVIDLVKAQNSKVNCSDDWDQIHGVVD